MPYHKMQTSLFVMQRGLTLIMNAPRGRGGGGQIACQIAYIINGRPQSSKAFNYNNDICIIKM